MDIYVEDWEIDEIFASSIPEVDLSFFNKQTNESEMYEESTELDEKTSEPEPVDLSCDETLEFRYFEYYGPITVCEACHIAVSSFKPYRYSVPCQKHCDICLIDMPALRKATFASSKCFKINPNKFSPLYKKRVCINLRKNPSTVTRYN